MNSVADPNRHAVTLVAEAIRPLLGDMVLVGGCAAGLLITDPARPPVRHTIDVDLLTEVTSKSDYYELAEKLRNLGFKEGEDVICRWRKDEIVVDVMPINEEVLGFSNRWYGLAVETAITTTLADGLVVRHVSPPLFVATKIEAFHGRGKGDYFHHDVEDIINVVDGRLELLEEVNNAPADVRGFIREEIDALLATPAFTDALPGHFRPDATEQARARLVLTRLRALAGL